MKVIFVDKRNYLPRLFHLENFQVVECQLKVQWVIGSIPHGGPLSYFSVQPMLHNWCALLSLWDDEYKRFLAANWKE